MDAKNTIFNICETKGANQKDPCSVLKLIPASFHIKYENNQDNQKQSTIRIMLTEEYSS